MALKLVENIKEKTTQWFNAQVLEIIIDNPANQSVEKEKKKWILHPEPWLKCNIGSSWAKKSKIGGSAWVLRDYLG